MIWPGALAAQAIYCAARLGLADHLAQGIDRVDCLATATNTHPGALRRLLRALCSLEVLVEEHDGRFSLTELGLTLRAEDASAVHPWAIMLGAPFVWRPWGRLLETVQTGEVAFDRIFGRPFSELQSLSPEDAEIFNTAMNAGATMNVPAIVRAYDFSKFDLIVDLGGGRGSLLRGILESHERPKGILFDLPEVVATATELRNCTVADRCEIVGGDFFRHVPAGADAYLLKGILHSHRDEEAIEILKQIRCAMHPDGRLLIVDVVLQEANEPNPQKALMDLMMLALVPGHERTEQEFRVLLERAGFELTRVVPTENRNAIVEGAPTEPV
jgi:hypothetical protein